MTISFHIPIQTVSEANSRGHWAKRAKRAKLQRGAAIVIARTTASPSEVRLPCIVRLTRIGPRQLDTDNLQSALKATRDGIADWLGIDDGCNDLVRWEYAQEVGSPPGVRVDVRSA